MALARRGRAASQEVTTHLAVWMAKVLDLCLGELTHAQQALARGNFVAVRLPNLRRRKGQPAAIVVKQVPAVWERTTHWPQNALPV